ncbi:catalase [Methylobacterium indicum]|uniref:catalase family protein n=1 Tax=Methylobacterium indicum TaxID=1775910 RepID=UPI000734AD15|nr:catalase family protein [Methylobacterium indicum]KTS26170.1 catalase [Methylobacterium indicum]KTS39458.1 catalase [Methylobacterium indicum]KTS51298.1 catalase [Methylobacterium indicum]
MPSPIRFDSSLEVVQPDEDEVQAEMIRVFRKIQETTLKDYGHAVRGVHAKSHGLLTGRLTVLPDLPPTLAQGLFAAPGSYDVVLRLSTNPGDILDDSVSTPRGLAVKVIGVSGERLPEAEGETQDFVLANAPAFTAPDAKAFLKSLKLLAATTDTPQVFKKVFSAALRGLEGAIEAVGGKSATLISLGGHPETHILGETFYSQAALRWGDYVAKVAVAPVAPALTALTGASLDVNGKPNGLREAVSEYFRAHEGVWELRAQLLTDRATMPVEDASKPWPEEESPYVPVARITVAPQESWSDDKVRRLDDGLAFSPWHGLAAHQPLGSVMRARRAVYPRSAGFRAEHNGCPIHAPTRA